MAFESLLTFVVAIPISLLCYREFYRIQYETKLFEKVNENRMLIQELQILRERFENGICPSAQELKTRLDGLEKHIDTLSVSVKSSRERIEYGNCGCNYYLVSGEYGVKDDALVASSEWDPLHRAYRSRLHKLADKTSTGVGSWASRTNDNHQFVQVQLKGPSRVVSVVTQGRHDVDQWVKSYKVLYSDDGVSWITIQDDLKYDRIFPGNTDQDTPVINHLECPVTARYVRVQPVMWHDHVSMRFDVLGCPVR